MQHKIVHIYTRINISISASQRYVGYVVIKYKKRKNIKNVSDGLSWVANMVRLMYLPVLQPYSLYPKISRFLFLLLLLFCVLVYVCFFSPCLLLFLFLLLLLLLFFHFNSFSIFLIRHHRIQNTHKKIKINSLPKYWSDVVCVLGWMLFHMDLLALLLYVWNLVNETKRNRAIWRTQLWMHTDVHNYLKKNTIIIYISVLIFKMRIVAAAYVTMSMKAMPYE